MAKIRRMFAIKKRARERILKVNPHVPTQAGIYIFTRVSEEGIKYAYVGQAKNLLDRCSNHLMNYQAIDLSIKKHGLYDQIKNPHGYDLACKCCDVSMLDENERKTILYFSNNGYQLKNKTIGGQGEGKTGLGDNKPPKGYRDGVVQGYKNCQRDVKVFFNKYLDYSIKGKTNKIKERKFQEFGEFLGGKNETN